MAKSFNTLSDGIDRDPVRRARVDTHKRAMQIALELGKVREAAGVSQQELAKRLKVSQANISRIERQGDVQLSTVHSYIKALGGDLRIEALIGGVTVPLIGTAAPLSSKRAPRATAKKKRGPSRKTASGKSTARKTAGA